MTFTIVDGGVFLVLFLSAILAYARGLTRELLSIGGWVLGAIAAFALAPTFEPLIKDVPVLGDFVAESCELSMLAAFAAVFAISLIIMSILTSALGSVVRESALGPIDRGLGFFFGVARGVLLLVIVFVLYKFLAPEGGQVPMIENAASYSMIADAADKLMAEAPTKMPEFLATWIDGLMDGCRTRQDGASA